MYRFLACFVVLVCIFWGDSRLIGQDHSKEYPLTLNVLETNSTDRVLHSDGVTTNCRTDTTGDNPTTHCTSRAVPDREITELRSEAEGSDGRTYSIKCAPSGGKKFAQRVGVGGSSHREGCHLPPGKYFARWDKGNMKILVEDGAKSKEQTFIVLGSGSHSMENKETNATSGTAMVSIISKPDGADIDLDGKFVGSTPSELNLAVGQHEVIIRKNGYLPYQRSFVVFAGSRPTISAELTDSQRREDK